jgi:hypothetical protein
MVTKFNRTRNYALEANEKGAIGEAIVAEAVRRVDSPNCVREFVAADLGLDPDESWEILADDRADLQRVEVAGGDDVGEDDDSRVLEWRPDFEFAVGRSTARGWRQEARYLVEVKTGGYAEFEREQKRAMLALSEEDENVIAVWVTLGEMPEAFGLRVRKMGEFASV